MSVGVVLERRQAASPWTDNNWRPVAVLPGQPEYQEKEGSVEVLWPNGTSPVQANCEISRFGNSWQIFAKRSFRVKCRASLGASNLQAPLFDGFDRGVLAKTSFDELEFRSGSQDATFSQFGF